MPRGVPNIPRARQEPPKAPEAAPATLAAAIAAEASAASPAAPAAVFSTDKYPQLSPTPAEAVATVAELAVVPPAPEPAAEPEALPPVTEPEAGAVLRKGAPPPAAVPHNPTDKCRVRITKAGHGKVHTGRENPKTYDWNDEVSLPRSVGRALEGKQFGEILD